MVAAEPRATSGAENGWKADAVGDSFWWSGFPGVLEETKGSFPTKMEEVL